MAAMGFHKTAKKKLAGTGGTGGLFMQWQNRVGHLSTVAGGFGIIWARSRFHRRI